MSKVHEFADAPALYDETLIPSPRLRNADAPGNFKFTLADLKAYLIAAGFSQTVVEVLAADVDIADSGSNFTATDVEGALAELATAINDLPASAGGAPSFVAFTVDGATITVSYWGSTAPTLGGSAGNYTVTLATGSEPRSVSIFAPAASGLAGIANLDVVIAGSRQFSADVIMTNLDGGTRFLPGQLGVVVKEAYGSNQVTNNIIGIGSVTTGYAAKLTF